MARPRYKNDSKVTDDKIEKLVKIIRDNEEKFSYYSKLVIGAKTKIKSLIGIGAHNYGSSKVILSERVSYELKDNAVELAKKMPVLQKYLPRLIYSQEAIKEDFLTNLLENDKITPEQLKKLYTKKVSQVLNIKHEA
jgi:hypothetical protein